MSHPVNILCDTGATSSLIRLDFASKAGLKISQTTHTANQADGKTKLDIRGEVQIELSRGARKLSLEALVVRDLDCDILAGMSFLEDNQISLDIPNHRIIIGGKDIIHYDQSHSSIPNTSQVRRSQSFLLRANEDRIVLPGDFLEVETPVNLQNDICFEPRLENPTWPPPAITTVVNGKIRIPNTSNSPVVIRKNQHVCQAYQTTDSTSIKDMPTTTPSDIPVTTPSSIKDINIDPDGILTSTGKQAFQNLHAKYKPVFSPDIGCYNDESGKMRASINIGHVEPPTQKGRLPAYNRNNLQELQHKMDELECMGVLAKPEDLGIIVEHVSPSFLVRKPSGGTRLVTAFNNIANYAKSPPSRVTNCEDVLTFASKWTHIIKTDMTSQFFQLPMKRSSMKYLGVITPFKGIRVYTRAAMGMPGSTEHLDELMFRVLGDLIEEGCVMKIADDLYIGGNSITDLLINWERVLIKFQVNNLRLSPKKTEICPVKTTLLGWVWNAGKISVSSHKLNPLASCEKPKTVKGLRSWIGAYKHIKACIPHYSSLLSDLETAVGGRDSKERVTWTEQLTSAFQTAQAALNDPKAITIPKPSDQLIITTDGAVVNNGIGSVLFIIRNGKRSIGGYFSAKLKSNQQRWLPCEVEALGISMAINHWNTYIINSIHETQVLTDSKPCIQAFQKLARGQFSSSARVSTFLSTLSRYNVQLTHLSGSANLPSDYLSRSNIQCEDGSRCQVCTFIAEVEQCSVRGVSVTDIIQGKLPMPYTTRTSWRVVQQDCPNLRRVYSHLTQGTRPTKKMTKVKDVKRYLQVTTLGPDGIMVVKHNVPFAGSRNLIVVPRHIVPGLLNALHLQLNHPSVAQMKRVFSRYYFALDTDEHIACVSTKCAQCAAIAKIPQEIAEFSTSPPPTTPGTQFAVDVLRRSGQKIFILRDTLTSYTVSKLILNEQSDTLRHALIETAAELTSPTGASIRVDGAFQPLVNDPLLLRHGLKLEVGRLKNKNKNPIAEKAVLELEIELRKCFPDGRPVTPSQLAVTVATLNKRIRGRGLSAKEMLQQRDNVTGEKLNISDKYLAEQQYKNRLANHGPSARSKASITTSTTKSCITPGDLVFLKDDGTKHTARERYIVTGCNKQFITLNKLTGNQFRSKKYHVKYSDVYKVPCVKIPRYSPQDIFESESSVSDSDHALSDNNVHSDSEDINNPFQDQVGDYTSDSNPSPNEDNLQDDLNTNNNGQNDTNNEHVEPIDNGGPSVRHRYPPSWMRSGQWEMGAK